MAQSISKRAQLLVDRQKKRKLKSKKGTFSEICEQASNRILRNKRKKEILHKEGDADLKLVKKDLVIGKLNIQISHLQREYKQLENELKGKNTKIKELQKEVEEVKGYLNKGSESYQSLLKYIKKLEQKTTKFELITEQYKAKLEKMDRLKLKFKDTLGRSKLINNDLKTKLNLLINKNKKMEFSLCMTKSMLKKSKAETDDVKCQLIAKVNEFNFVEEVVNKYTILSKALDIVTNALGLHENVTLKDLLEIKKQLTKIRKYTKDQKDNFNSRNNSFIKLKHIFNTILQYIQRLFNTSERLYEDQLEEIMKQVKL